MKQRSIDDAIDDVLKFMKSYQPNSEEYSKAVSNLKELCEARSKKPSRIVEVDTIILAATNLLGIILILNHEQLHVITTKAIGFVVKGRF